MLTNIKMAVPSTTTKSSNSNHFQYFQITYISTYVHIRCWLYPPDLCCYDRYCERVCPGTEVPVKPFEPSILAKDVDQIAQPPSRLLLLNDSTIQLLRRARLFGILMPFRLLRCIESVPPRGRRAHCGYSRW